ncbi:hypothetical protein [Halocatena halophila]|uniref:hypothetical protein n=1 Tax=Halocatena halophila TaxID=2814576 RepID=UPI002ED50E2C
MPKLDRRAVLKIGGGAIASSALSGVVSAQPQDVPRKAVTGPKGKKHRKINEFTPDTSAIRGLESVKVDVFKGGQQRVTVTGSYNPQIKNSADDFRVNLEEGKGRNQVNPKISKILDNKGKSGNYDMGQEIEREQDNGK